MTGNAHDKRNCWSRGNGANSFRGELKRSIRLNRKMLNHKVRRSKEVPMHGGGYKKIGHTQAMAYFP